LTKIWANQEHKPRRAAASNGCSAPVSLARVGLVLSFDASRLARNKRDWYQLLEVCSIFGTLIVDGERLSDPRLSHDRRLVGLSGMMSSWADRRSDLHSRRRSSGTHPLGVGEIPGNRLSWRGEAVSVGGALALAGSPSARPCSSTLVIWQEASTSAV
jgi:hypothetical protein